MIDVMNGSGGDIIVCILFLDSKKNIYVYEELQKKKI